MAPLATRPMDVTSTSTWTMLVVKMRIQMLAPIIFFVAILVTMVTEMGLYMQAKKRRGRYQSHEKEQPLAALGLGSKYRYRLL